MARSWLSLADSLLGRGAGSGVTPYLPLPQLENRKPVEGTTP